MVEANKGKAKTIASACKRQTIVVNTPLKKVTLVANDEELVAVSPERRNWRGIFIALLVIAAVFSLIIFSIFLLSPEDEILRIQGRRMTLGDVLGKGLKWKRFNGTWANDVELIYRDPSGGLSVLNLDNGTTRILMTNSTFRQLNAESFVVSSDLKFVLMVSETDSEGSRYHIYDIQARTTLPLGPKENSIEAPKLQFVMWAPFHHGGSTSNINTRQTNSNIGVKLSSQAIAFVHQNDLYYKPKVQGDLVCRITTNGERDKIYNGIPDWFYKNVPELKSEAVAFSPDGLYMSFLVFNDSLVHEYRYTWMGDGLKYPEVKSVRYPKTGTTNPNVTVFVVNLSVLKYIFPQQVKFPASISNGSYIGAMTWPSPTDLSFIVTNREQTKATTVICRAPSFNCYEVYTEVTTNDGWVLLSESPIFSKLRFQHELNLFLNTTSELNILKTSSINATNNQTLNSTSRNDLINTFSIGSYMLKRLPIRDGEHGHFRHIVFISLSDRRSVALTMGRYEVTEIVGWDETNEIIYFMVAPEKKPFERHLYKINLHISTLAKTNRTSINTTQPTCLTCDNGPSSFKLINMSENQTQNSEDCEMIIPNNCLFNKIYFSKDYSYYVQECLGPEAPSVYLVETQTNMKIHVLHSGNILRWRLSQLALPQVRTFSVEIRHGFHAQVRLLLPPGVKEDEEAAFPLILQIDASPGSQLVSHKYEVDWNWYMCSQRSMIIAQIDGRGSGYQGELLRTQVHGKLGSVEIEDQLAVLTYLRDNLKFIDQTRICAYGWGYGGYASTMTLIEDSQHVLQCSIAVNPIVSFSYHYSFFTERYIPLNGDYLRALQESDLTMKAGNIKERSYMLVHGTADTLVHQEHSLMLARSLINQDISFRQQVYADQDHQLSGSIYHLYKTLETYIDECFGPSEDNEWDPTGFLNFKQ